MPVFEKLKILFIHIPKTGGTSIEHFFYKKYSIPVNTKSLYGFENNKKIGIMFRSKINKSRISLQHYTWLMLQEHKNTLFPNNVIFDKNSYKILTVVRNPYNRIISEIFYQKLITRQMTREEIYSIIYNYLHVYNNTEFDNHRIPQYVFLIDENNKILEDITILKTESLTTSMHELGFTDFPDIKYNSTVSVSDSNIKDYLNEESIKLINTYYRKDFEYFDYEMILLE